MAKTHSHGRKPAKPEYSAEKNLTNQMDAAVALYKSDMTLQVIADELSLNPIKVRKLLITAGVYQSDIADTRAADVPVLPHHAGLQNWRVLHHGRSAVVSPVRDLVPPI